MKKHTKRDGSSRAISYGFNVLIYQRLCVLGPGPCCTRNTQNHPWCTPNKLSRPSPYARVSPSTKWSHVPFFSRTLTVFFGWCSRRFVCRILSNFSCVSPVWLSQHWRHVCLRVEELHRLTDCAQAQSCCSVWSAEDLNEDLNHKLEYTCGVRASPTCHVVIGFHGRALHVAPGR